MGDTGLKVVDEIELGSTAQGINVASVGLLLHCLCHAERGRRRPVQPSEFSGPVDAKVPFLDLFLAPTAVSIADLKQRKCSKSTTSR